MVNLFVKEITGGFIDTVFQSSFCISFFILEKVINNMLSSLGLQRQLKFNLPTLALEPSPYVTTSKNLPSDLVSGTYMQLNQGSAISDFMLVRQIGTNNEFWLAFDTHDNQTDGQISFRTIDSTTNPAVPPDIKTFFRITRRRGVYNPHHFLTKAAGDIDLGTSTYLGVTTVFIPASASGSITLPQISTTNAGNGCTMRIVNKSGSNVSIVPQGTQKINGTAGALTLATDRCLELVVTNDLDDPNWFGYVLTAP